jgi:hypothetical protein
MLTSRIVRSVTANGSPTGRGCAQRAHHIVGADARRVKSRCGDVEAIRALSVARLSALGEADGHLNQVRHMCFSADLPIRVNARRDSGFRGTRWDETPRPPHIGRVERCVTWRFVSRLVAIDQLRRLIVAGSWVRSPPAPPGRGYFLSRRLTIRGTWPFPTRLAFDASLRWFHVGLPSLDHRRLVRR